MLTDSHCHLDRLDLSPYDGDLSSAITAAQDRGVERILCIGIDMANAETVVNIANQYANVYASVGVHPLDVAEELVQIAELESLARSEKVLAIGETGLDYYYKNDTAELQQQSFKLHLDLAKAVNKPVVVHTRDAREDTLAIIRESGISEVGGVLHCFTENWAMASAALDENFYISFSGIITFKNATQLRDVVAKVPLERMLVETDAPYLAPVPYRGKKNEPKYVVEVAQCIADIKGLSLPEVSEITSNNFDKLFLNKE